ncbi:T-complex protein 1 subunit zeta-like [Tropilaelaps mercedesae]|uniref:T-complex protein 1 subunit zeta-like n=1 Tax=Tropilaelaps mercedesae TaxID=418985 RepID=A0A1V9X4B0_9ACAR|nr:T-complex protein 1 subunit zeta-like [Tropilaelaps mercedesae]
MAAYTALNPKAEVARSGTALAININAARGLQDVLRSNLGPKGTMKMLVSGAGDIKITKDGNVLLHEMQIQHPTASLIARASTAQNDITGDGTTSTVLLIGELLKQAHLHIQEGLHPRVLVNGFELAQKKALEVLDQMKITQASSREMLMYVAKTSLSTKVYHELAERLTEACVDAVLAIKTDNSAINLHMVEIMEMQHKTDKETKLIRGLVLDHGSRHPDMPKMVKNAYILAANVSMEYEKTEVNSGFFYKSAEERDQLVKAEREFIENRVKKVIELKKQVCGTDKSKGFVLINQQGIDPMSLDLLAKEGIMALRRAKRRNMERLTLATGATAVNSMDGLTPDVLGFAGQVFEHVLGENKYTFIEDLKNPKSVTILIKGPNKHTITMIKDAVHDGLRSVKNAIEDDCIVPGAGAFEIAAHYALMEYEKEVKDRAVFGVRAFAEALLVIVKTLAANSGLDPMDTLVKLQKRYHQERPQPVGLNLSTGEPCDPAFDGIFDNWSVHHQLITACTVIASNLLLVDEIMFAGVQQKK